MSNNNTINNLIYTNTSTTIADKIKTEHLSTTATVSYITLTQYSTLQVYWEQRQRNNLQHGVTEPQRHIELMRNNRFDYALQWQQQPFCRKYVVFICVWLWVGWDWGFYFIPAESILRRIVPKGLYRLFGLWATWVSNPWPFNSLTEIYLLE